MQLQSTTTEDKRPLKLMMFSSTSESSSHPPPFHTKLLVLTISCLCILTVIPSLLEIHNLLLHSSSSGLSTQYNGKDTTTNNTILQFTTLSPVLSKFLHSFSFSPYYKEYQLSSSTEGDHRDYDSERYTLAFIRLFISFFIFSVSLKTILQETWIHETKYSEKSKLKAIPIQMSGLLTQAYFTACSWNLLGLSFLINGIIPLVEVRISSEDNASATFLCILLCKIATLLFETVGSTTILVSFIIKYVIWQRKLNLKKKTDDDYEDPTKELKAFRNLTSHNLNLIFVLVEVNIVGNLSFTIKNTSLPPLFGMAYVLFSYFYAPRWGASTSKNKQQFLQKKQSDQYLYFFLDTTLGKNTSISLLVLLFVLVSFHLIFCLLSYLMNTFFLDAFIVRILVTIAISCVFCRFRD